MERDKRIRILVAVVVGLWLVATLALNGPRMWESVRRFFPSESDAPLDAGIPPHDPSLDAVDSRGSTPASVALAFTDALNTSNWRGAYAMVHEPPVDLDAATRAWSRDYVARRTFEVLETRIVEDDAAWIRVWYTLDVEPTEIDGVTFTEGAWTAWWELIRVDGVWLLTSTALPPT